MTPQEILEKWIRENYDVPSLVIIDRAIEMLKRKEEHQCCCALWGACRESLKVALGIREFTLGSSKSEHYFVFTRIYKLENRYSDQLEMMFGTHRWWDSGDFSDKNRKIRIEALKKFRQACIEAGKANGRPSES